MGTAPEAIVQRLNNMNTDIQYIVDVSVVCSNETLMQGWRGYRGAPFWFNFVTLERGLVKFVLGLCVYILRFGSLGPCWTKGTSPPMQIISLVARFVDGLERGTEFQQITFYGWGHRGHMVTGKKGTECRISGDVARAGTCFWMPGRYEPHCTLLQLISRAAYKGIWFWLVRQLNESPETRWESELPPLLFLFFCFFSSQ